MQRIRRSLLEGQREVPPPAVRMRPITAFVIKTPIALGLGTIGQLRRPAAKENRHVRRAEHVLREGETAQERDEIAELQRRVAHGHLHERSDGVIAISLDVNAMLIGWLPRLID